MRCALIRCGRHRPLKSGAEHELKAVGNASTASMWSRTSNKRKETKLCVTHPAFRNSNDAGQEDRTAPVHHVPVKPQPIKPNCTGTLTGRPARNVQDLLRGHAEGRDRDATLLRQ